MLLAGWLEPTFKVYRSAAAVSVFHSLSLSISIGNRWVYTYVVLLTRSVNKPAKTCQFIKHVSIKAQPNKRSTIWPV